MAYRWVPVLPVAIATLLALEPVIRAAQPESQSPAQAAPAAKGTGAILGQVLEEASGQPISDAIVTLSMSASARPERVMTDARGRFLFHGLRVGSFTIRIAAPGYVTSGSSSGTLADGQRISDLRIRLAKYAVVSGTVFDEAGEPAVGVSVNIVGEGARWSGAVTTDDRGAYRRALPPGNWLLAVPQSRMTTPTAVLDEIARLQAALVTPTRFSAGGQSGRETRLRIGDLVLSSSGPAPVIAPDGRLLVYQSIYYPSAATQAMATVITLASGEDRTGIDFRLRLVSTSSVSGVVMGPNGPSKNTAVELVPVASDVSKNVGFRTFANKGSVSSWNSAGTRTRDDGTFTVLAVPEGSYVARVIKTPATKLPPQSGPPELGQMLRMAQEMMGEDADSPVLVFAEAPVMVAASDVTGVRLTLREGIKVTGRLEFEGTQPVPTGAQLRSFFVSLLPVGRTSLGGEPLGPNVDENGRFRTPGRVSGRHWLNVDRSLRDTQGARPWIVKSVLVAGRDVSNEGVELRDADVNDAVVTLTDRTATVTGVVRGPDGMPPAGVSVIAIPGGYQAWIENDEIRGRRLRPISLSKSGEYSIDALLAGDYWLAAIDEAAFQDAGAGFYRAVAGVATAVRIGEDERRTQNLQVVKVVR